MVHVAGRQRRHVPPRATRTTVSTTCGAWRLEKENPPSFPRAGIGAAADPAAGAWESSGRHAARGPRRMHAAALRLRPGRVADVRGQVRRRNRNMNGEEKIGPPYLKAKSARSNGPSASTGARTAQPPKKITTQFLPLYISF